MNIINMIIYGIIIVQVAGTSCEGLWTVVETVIYCTDTSFPYVVGGAALLFAVEVLVVCSIEMNGRNE